MKRLVLAVIGAIALTQTAVAQEREGEQYCLHLQREIAIKQQSLAGMSSLVNTSAYTMVSCDIDPNNPYTYERDECLSDPYAQGFWHDQETRTFYVIYTKQYIQQYAQGIGASSSDLQRSFAASDRVVDKLRYGGVIESLEAEIASWQAEYDRACAGFQQQQDPWDPSHGLLNVVPGN